MTNQPQQRHFFSVSVARSEEWIHRIDFSSPRGQKATGLADEYQQGSEGSASCQDIDGNYSPYFCPCQTTDYGNRKSNDAARDGKNIGGSRMEFIVIHDTAPILELICGLCVIMTDMIDARLVMIWRVSLSGRILAVAEITSAASCRASH
ncbi:hypothetical protein [Paracoccus versutus]|uniref:hypothetical protein n=1 Tax=Paracoccus versutus TaxID=34007 RepID=UPI0011C02B97|nr:hypothetical protein [Paracoccus versutus]